MKCCSFRESDKRLFSNPDILPTNPAFPLTPLFVFLPSARRHRQGNTDEHQRPMGGRGERTKGSLPIHPCENHRPPESGRERLTLVSAWTLSPVIVPVPEPAGRLHLVPASVATVTCLPAWGCTMIATPPLLPTVARLSDCLQLWTLGPNLKKKKTWSHSSHLIIPWLGSRLADVFLH